jgi:hypothetical protein
MKVHELIEWLKTQPQEAVVEVVKHESGRSHYDQGGNARTETFSLESKTPLFEVTEAWSYKGTEYPATLLLGVYQG